VDAGLERAVSEPITRVTLFVPGTPASMKEWNATELLRGIDVQVDAEWVANDGAFGTAFSFGTVGPDVIARLEAAPGALVLHWPIDLRAGREPIIAVVERLRAAGAIAVRIEQSKLGWEVARWLELFSSIFAPEWHRGAVAVIVGDEVLQTCGMHAFSLPDVRVEYDDDAGAMQQLATTLNVYQLAEDPVIRSGDTFRPDAETPRRLVERWPDLEYPPDHACHNPYGVWRLGPAGGTARPLGDLALVFMPSLHALLRALEDKQGKPLTKQQVEAARDTGTCIAMEPRDQQRLERERGYADLDPELAWEQWKLVRKRGG
jgi:hypothetical protein